MFELKKLSDPSTQLHQASLNTLWRAVASTCNGVVVAQVCRDRSGDQRIGPIHGAAGGCHKQHVPAKGDMAIRPVERHRWQRRKDESRRDTSCSAEPVQYQARHIGAWVG